MLQSNIQGIEIGIAIGIGIGTCSGGMTLFFNSDTDFEFNSHMKS